MKKTTRTLMLTLTPLAVLLSAGAALAQPGDPGQQAGAAPAAPRTLAKLFAPAAEPAGATKLRQAKTSLPVLPNLPLLQSATPGKRIVLNLGPGVEFVMVVTRVEHHGSESTSITGLLDGVVHSSVAMVVQDDALASEITAPPIGLHYKTKYAANGVHYISEMNDDLYAPCGGGKPAAAGVGIAEDFFPEAGEEQGIDPRAPQPQPEGACANVGVVFDQMIIYSNVAREAAGGTSAIQAECQLAIDRTNESYQNSPISARARLVARYEVTYDEVGIYDNHLDRLTGVNGQGGGAPWTTARSNRDANNADFCTLWVDDGEFCGLAWCTSAADRGYSVVTWSCAAGNLSQPHEIGHNQGCDHDPANSGSGCAASSYSFGHRFNGNDGVQYRTVMSYAPGTRIPYFSNPSQTFQGVATGTATRDNERTIEDRKGTCEGFELTRWDIWVDFAAIPVIELGTFSWPFNSVTEGVAVLDNYVTGASEYPNLYIKQGSSNWTGTISKVMTITPCGGPVTIGN